MFLYLYMKEERSIFTGPQTHLTINHLILLRRRKIVDNFFLRKS